MNCTFEFTRMYKDDVMWYVCVEAPHVGSTLGEIDSSIFAMISDIGKQGSTVIMLELSLYLQSFMTGEIVNDWCNAQMCFCVLR